MRGGCSSSFNRRVVRSSSWHPRPIGLSLPCGVVLSRYMALATAKGAADSRVRSTESPAPTFLASCGGSMKPAPVVTTIRAPTPAELPLDRELR